MLTYRQLGAIHSLNVFGLLPSQVAPKPFHSQKFARSSPFKTPGCTFMCFKFWHSVFPSVQFDASRPGLATR